MFVRGGPAAATRCWAAARACCLLGEQGGDLAAHLVLQGARFCWFADSILDFAAARGVALGLGGGPLALEVGLAGVELLLGLLELGDQDVVVVGGGRGVLRAGREVVDVRDVHLAERGAGAGALVDLGGPAAEDVADLLALGDGGVGATLRLGDAGLGLLPAVAWRRSAARRG